MFLALLLQLSGSVPVSSQSISKDQITDQGSLHVQGSLRAAEQL